MKDRKRVISLALLLLGMICFLSCIPALPWIIQTVGTPSLSGTAESIRQTDLQSAYSSHINNLVSAALDGLVAIPKIYTLPEEQVVAPAPREDCFGSSADPHDTAKILERAKERFGLEQIFWNVDRELFSKSDVHWYLDDTIFSITWKEVVEGSVFSFSEIVIAHPSQFRRYLAEDTFGSPLMYHPTDMAATVNAVTALSADFYRFRTVGSVVYHGQLYRADGKTLDICFVDSSGNLNFVPRGTLTTKDELLQYISDHDIRFSLCFGPIMLQDGELCVPRTYPVGEINEIYARCCICQLDELHYLLVTVNGQYPYRKQMTLRQVAEILQEMGIHTAYSLDGGQTATMYADHALFNAVEFGYQRTVSDIIYFATALPEEEQEG